MIPMATVPSLPEVKAFGADPLPAALHEVETPAAVVDLAVVWANARRVVQYARRHGLSWRPHTKTHKSARMGRLQVEAGAAGLTVATPREAEVMAGACRDLLVAYPPVGRWRLERVLDVAAGVRTTVALDHPDTLDALSRAALDRGSRVGVLVEVDVGMGRVGVGDPAEVLELAERVASAPGVEYRGILFYPGHIRSAGRESDAGIRALASSVEALVRLLEGAGLAPGVVSGGSTPFLFRSHEVPGLTEIRSGTVLFGDRECLQSGASGPEDLAYSVLATVVSVPSPRRAVVDAGSKALAREPPRGGLEGFGILLEHPGVVVESLSEEHGVLDLRRGAWQPRVGERVRIVPNHVCVSVNLQDRLWVVEGEGVEPWALEARGRDRWDGGAPGDR